MNWKEDLPEQCPPEKAFEPNDFKVFRLATNKNIDESDFQSQRALKPKAKFKGVDECIARSISVFDEINKCLNMAKLPLYKNKWKAVLEIELNESDGLALKTFKDPCHYSWWRSTTFDINNSILKTIE
ncbi:hypothetical protein G3567_09990 [Psychroflexus sp. YR1-1]|uniref:Uncharacterized protein n=1 Tax=Psychroflexus aurantiacus TaxID=2709310 RepID=A0A6B3RA65_9FLAO|nr:hypothetical protein [Psychroflexus aurantiacus]NEV94471.1 hypothetical protein [Psychroflexus aurantiacus]